MVDGEGTALGGARTATPTATLDDLPATAEAPAPPSESRRLPYNPALDGIRGLAVAAVVLFHGGFSWARGGYLGVSTFFTLSGFLITTLLLAEHGRRGRIGLTAFWARRLRRLLPAAAATLALVMLTAFFTDELWERTLRGDVIAAALNVANWRFLFEDRSYAALFSDPSPVLHFWSLAIEEQFYWVFPLLTAGVLALGRGSRAVFAGVLGGLLVVSGVVTLLFSDRPTTVYYSTFTRMGEILVGALLAMWWATTPAGIPSRWRPAIGGLGALGLAGSVWAWWNVERQTSALYHGGFLLYAVLSAALVLAASVPGPIQRFLAFEPFRRLGVISYGVYLIHWPVFLLLDEDRLGVDDPALFGLRVGVSLALAVASYRLLEEPIRRGRRPRVLKAPPLALGAVAGVIGLALVVPQLSEPPADPFAEATQRLETTGPPSPAELRPDGKVGVTLGDSTGLMTFLGLTEWGHENKRLALVGGGGGIGCGIGRGGEVRYQDTDPAPVDENPWCRSWESDLQAAVELARTDYGRIDLAVVQSGPWDVADRRLEGDDQWRHVGDPVYDAYLRDELAHAADLLLDQGITVVWLTAPYTHSDFPESDPARIDGFNRIVRELAEEKQGMVLVDLAGWIESLPPGEDARLRPDGVHFSMDPPTHVEVARTWLGEQVLTASTQERPPGAAGS